MKFANATKPRQEIRGMGHPEFCGGSCRAKQLPLWRRRWRGAWLCELLLVIVIAFTAK